MVSAQTSDFRLHISPELVLSACLCNLSTSHRASPHSGLLRPSSGTFATLTTGFWFSSQCFLIPRLALFYSPHHGLWTCVPVTVHSCKAYILNVDIGWTAAWNHSTMIFKLSFKINLEHISRHTQE